MIFSWWRKRRRKALLMRPMAIEWGATLARHFAHWRGLTAVEQRRLLDIARVIKAEKDWRGGNGLEVTLLMRRVVSAQAALLLLGRPDHDYFRNVETIVIHPDGYYLPGDGAVSASGAAEGTRAVLGHAAQRGGVVLSWKHSLAGGENAEDGRNLVFHEFAHKLDMLDGAVDGTPPLPSRAAARRWFEVMTEAYEDLQAALAKGRSTLIDAYGATNVAEFFAVCTEHFFEQSVQLRARLPALYDCLAEAYGQDPASRKAGPRPRTHRTWHRKRR
jgi:hypothetical protein